MRLFPGFGSPSPPPPPPPVPTRDTAADEREGARKMQRQAEKRRAGRASTILSDRDDDKLAGGSGSISRPQARSARLLGS